MKYNILRTDLYVKYSIIETFSLFECLSVVSSKEESQIEDTDTRKHGSTDKRQDFRHVKFSLNCRKPQSYEIMIPSGSI